MHRVKTSLTPTSTDNEYLDRNELKWNDFGTCIECFRNGLNS